MLKNRKSQGLSINVIIVAVVALIVLIALIAIFTGRLGSWGTDVTAEEDQGKIDARALGGEETITIESLQQPPLINLYTFL